MSKKLICSEYTDAEQYQTTQITLTDFILGEIKYIERFLGIIAKHDEEMIEKLLLNYRDTLGKMNIHSEKNKFLDQFSFDFTEYKFLNNYSEYIPLIENATLFFLNFSKYVNQLSKENKISVLMTDSIRGGFFPLYYLVFSLLEITSRDVVRELAKDFTDICYEIEQNNIKKAETVEEYAKSLHNGLCPKVSNSVRLVEDGKFYVKITRCMWAEVYSTLPDLEIANLLECYGDFSKMPYINPNFVLTRTKTCVEGDPICDFVYHDKRIVTEIKHPDEEFWKNF